MKTAILAFCLWLGICAGGFCRAQTAPTPTPPTPAANGDKLVFADFEAMKDNRPVSNRGGYIQLSTYQENPGNAGEVKGLAGANPPAPELVRLSKDNPNHAAAFDYALRAPNQYAGVTLEVHGLPDAEGKTVPDDVTAYKYLELQLYATGVNYIRVEFVSRGQGLNLAFGYPQTTFRVSPGLNTYKLPLKSLAQPSYVQDKVNVKDLLKKLTAVNISAYCDQCTPVQGTLVVDNMVFIK